MKILRLTALICIANLVSMSCNFNENKTSKQNAVPVDNLADGRYRYCSEAPPDYDAAERGDAPDSYRWCFDFNKMGNKVIGTYIYLAPHDTPHICIEGELENNQVSGIGYIQTYGASEPFEEKELMKYYNSESSKLSYWDDFKGLQGGNNLRVADPEVHRLGGDSFINSYYAWIRFNTVQLDLDKLSLGESNPFERKNLENPTCNPDD